MQESTPQVIERPRAAQFIEIVEPNETFDWQYTDARGITYASVFELQLVPDELNKKWRKELTKPKVVRGTVVQELDQEEYERRILNHAIRGWRDVKMRGVNVECTPATRMGLPELLKAEIVRLCLGKELGLAIAEARDAEKNG